MERCATASTWSSIWTKSKRLWKCGYGSGRQCKMYRPWTRQWLVWSPEEGFGLSWRQQEGKQQSEGRCKGCALRLNFMSTDDRSLSLKKKKKQGEKFIVMCQLFQWRSLGQFCLSAYTNKETHKNYCTAGSNSKAWSQCRASVTASCFPSTDAHSCLKLQPTLQGAIVQMHSCPSSD